VAGRRPAGRGKPAEAAARIGPLALFQRSPVSRRPRDRGQRLIACPLLDAALELCEGCRGCTSWMPNDPYDLANTPAPTASCRRSAWEGGALAVSAAAVTDHVCDSWHREPASSPDSRDARATLRRAAGNPRDFRLTGPPQAGAMAQCRDAMDNDRATVAETRGAGLLPSGESGSPPGGASERACAGRQSALR
jgi:hypothetical protein